MQLSPHFSLEELIATQHREFIPQQAEQAKVNGANLRRLAQFLELVRAKMAAVRAVGFLGLIILSGLRCWPLNKAVGGSATSVHPLGLAADIISPSWGTPYDICRFIAASDLEFDQLIYEHTWVHIGLAPDGQKPRRQVLTLVGPNQYAEGIILKSA